MSRRNEQGTRPVRIRISSKFAVLHTERDSNGMASIVIVGVLVVLLALISIGFSKIMNRAVTRSLNNQLSSAATYAAQSGINDAMAYIKGQPNPSDVSSNDCTSLLKEPGMSNLTDLSGDGNTKITCLMVNPTPTDLMYQQLSPNGSQVIKATTSDAVDKVMFSWQASNGTNTNSPSSLSFTDVTTWNNAGNVPVLRVGLYPVPPSGKIAGIEANAKTFFLVPGQGGSNVTTIPYSTADGSVEQVACNAKNTGINGFTADYTCNAIVDGLYANIAPNSYYYLTVTPIYNQADVKIKATNSQKQQVQFINVQTVIDSTAKANNATKRLQERVDSNTTGDNIAASDDAAPGYSIRSAKALCKQLEFHKSYYNYVLNDAPSTCQTGGSGIQTVPPTLKLTITGNDGMNNGVTRDSGDATPSGSGYYGAVYVDSRATINWKSTDSALSCDASGGWSGDKNPASSWSGVTGTGSQTFSGLSNYTTYSMACKGPGGTTPTRTVTAWPPPRVSISSSSYHAGQSYSVSWSANNASRCQISSNGNENWNQTYGSVSPTGASDSKSFGTSWDDHSSKSYTITCWDPEGRSDSDSILLGVQGSGGTYTIYPPSCNATAKFNGQSTDNATISWSTSCSAVPTSLSNVYIDTNVRGIGSGYNTVNGGGAGNVRITDPGTYHFQVYIWAPGWHSQGDAAGYGGTSGDGEANSGYQQITIYPPMSGSLYVPAWQQFECAKSPSLDPGYWGRWLCRPNPTTPSTQGCADSNHSYTVCPSAGYWQVSGGSGNISCSVSAAGYPVFARGGASGGIGPIGWGGYSGGGSPYPFSLDCKDNVTGDSLDVTYNG